MESWPEHLARHSYDVFWMENEPVFHAYDYGANIEIEVNEGAAELRPRDQTASARTVMTRLMLTPGTIREALQGVMRVGINPWVAHKSGRWIRTHLMGCTLMS